MLRIAMLPAAILKSSLRQPAARPRCNTTVTMCTLQHLTCELLHNYRDAYCRVCLDGATCQLAQRADLARSVDMA
eukprot:5054840-Amphidinium_carterae.1